ncbi:hypothetical protein LguiB_011971 [Lonicera macranthoides]
MIVLVVLSNISLRANANTNANANAIGTGGVALFIFGDSTVDPGNNNYIDTIPENQANYKPYAQNGFFQQPTGRFSDGRVFVDFIADYAKLPLIPPFLQPSAKEYAHGVNFASGGAGILPETNQGLAIDLKTQLKQFTEVEKSIREKLGDAGAKEVLSEAVYFISIGSNDYMGGYLGNPKMQQLHQPEEYIGMVIGNLTTALQELYMKGGRKFGVLSLGPLGCLPALRAVNPGANEGGCFEEASGLALAHNNALKSVLAGLQLALQGFKYSNSNLYNWLDDRMKNPSLYGFKEGVNACCGSGPYGGVFTCGGTKKLKDYDLCENANEHVWWDSFHPTDKLHEQMAMAIWNGPPILVTPFNLQHFFITGASSTIADTVDDPQRNQIF